MQKTRLFPNIFRLLDNLCTYNNDEYQKIYNGIYPDGLELRKGNNLYNLYVDNMYVCSGRRQTEQAYSGRR